MHTQGHAPGRDCRSAVWLVAILFPSLFLVPLAAATRLPSQEPTATKSSGEKADGYDPHRDAQKDFEQVSAEAKRSNRNIFVVVGGNWCSWCHVLDRFFREHPELEKLRDNYYVSMKVNMSQENPNRAFLSRYPYIHGYPHIFVLDSNGRLIKSQSTRELEEGDSYNLKRFEKFLRKFAPTVSR